MIIVNIICIGIGIYGLFLYLDEYNKHKTTKKKLEESNIEIKRQKKLAEIWRKLSKKGF